MKIIKILILLLFIPLISCNLKKDSPLPNKNLKSITWKLYTPQNSDLHTHAIFNILIDRYGNKWITTLDKGLVKFSADGQWQIYTTSNSGLPDNLTRSLAMDYQDNLWIGTSDGGLVKFDGTNWTVYNPSNSPLLYDHVLSIDVDTKNTVWFTSCINRSGGLMSYDGIEWNLYTPGNSSLPTNLIEKIFVDPRDNVWLAPASGGAVKISEGKWAVYENFYGNGSPTYSLDDFCADNKGNIWASSSGIDSSLGIAGTLVRYNGKEWKEFLPSETGRLGNGVACIACDHFSNVWASIMLGVGDVGLTMFNGEEWFIIQDIDPDFPKKTFLWDMAFDENNTLWGTIPDTGFGLIEIHPEYE